MDRMTLESARSWMKTAAQLIADNASMLTELDKAIGDGDHGENMNRGFRAVLNKLDNPAITSVSALFKTVGMTLLSTVGGAAGPLYGGFFLALANSSAGQETLSRQQLADCLAKGLADIQRRGKAQLGDKTIVDSLSPAADAFQLLPDGDVAQAAQAAAERARTAAEATIPLLARKGRASYLGERSIGHQDPGATSCWLLLQALAQTCNPQ